MENNELLLHAWIELAIAIKANRLLEKLSMNQMMILSIINHEKEVTAARLCSRMNLLKSQMNRELSAMVKEKLITVEKSLSDKRKSFLSLTEKGKELYEKEHVKIMTIMDRINDRFGLSKAEELSKEMLEALKIFKEAQHD